MSWLSKLLGGGRPDESNGAGVPPEPVPTEGGAPRTVFLEPDGEGGFRAKESRLIRPQSDEERKEFGEAVCRQVGDIFKSISFNMNDGTTLSTYVYGMKGVYTAVAGDGKTLVYDENWRELLAEIDGLIFPGTQ